MSSNGSYLGNLGTDVELRSTQSGKSVAKARLAVTTGFGERQVTSWWSIEVWGRKAEIVAEHFRKGSRILVHGEAYIDEWEGKDGTKRVTPTITVNDFAFVDKREDGATAAPRRAAPPARRADPDPDRIPF